MTHRGTTVEQIRASEALAGLAREHDVENLRPACSNCTHHARGRCHRYPPQVWDGAFGFPCMDSHQYCSEHTPMAAELSKEKAMTEPVLLAMDNRFAVADVTCPHCHKHIEVTMRGLRLPSDSEDSATPVAPTVCPGCGLQREAGKWQLYCVRCGKATCSHCRVGASYVCVSCLPKRLVD